MAAYPMPNTRRSALWLLILLLFALACLRSLAPERTEGAIRRLIAKRNQVQDEFEKREKKLSEEKEEIQREKAALERWKTELDQRRQKLDEEEKHNSTHHHLPEENIHVNQDVDELVNSITNETTNVTLDTNTDPETDTDDQSPGHHATEQAHEIYSPDLADEPAPTLSEEECPIIVVPEHAKAGLGTQIQHIWTSLSLTLSIRNACVVVPPVLAQDGGDTFNPVPFHQVFDAHELSRTGLRFVPLRTCQPHGVATVIDDAGRDSAIVKTFAQYVGESHPKLAAESTLVHGDSTGIRFPDQEIIGGDPNVVGKYIRENLPEEKGRQCVGLGRMRAQVEINPDVLTFFKPASEVAAYVDDKYPLATQTVFVKLRWNKAHCSDVGIADGTVCINGYQTVPVLEYVSAIAHLAKVSGAARIYLAAPAHIPDQISAYLASHLETVEPVLLHVEGDLFTAGLVERELAVRALRFVPDGGNWGESVLRTRKAQYPDYYVDGLDSQAMIDQWKGAGWPKDSTFLRRIDASGQGELNLEPNSEEHEEHSPTGNHLTNQTSRPDEYVPPSHYTPANDDDETIRKMAKHSSSQSIQGEETSPSDPVGEANYSSAETDFDDSTANAREPIDPDAEKEGAQKVSNDEPAISDNEPSLTQVGVTDGDGEMASTTDPSKSDEDTTAEGQPTVLTEQQEASAAERGELSSTEQMRAAEELANLDSGTGTYDEIIPATQEGPQPADL